MFYDAYSVIFMANIKRGLKLIGLTELEADVYIKLLRLKQARISQLAKETSVTRTQLYPLLEKLVEKGVVEKIEQSVTIYRVIDSKKIISLLEKWKREQLSVLKELQDELKGLK
jgi:HTH-type transcriptional regulator, sugar sensing transcriptional regulator